MNFASKIEQMNFPQFLEMKFLEWQREQGGRKTVKEFAAYIGVSQSTISTWWNEDRKPEGENLQRLALKLGMEVYDVLGKERPDTDLHYIQSVWENLEPSAPKQDISQEYQQQITDLERKQKRLLSLYEEDTTPETSTARQTIIKRIKEIQNEIDTTRAKLTKQTILQNRRTAEQNTRAKLAQLIDHLEGYYTQAPAAQVNADLHAIITRIEISQTHQITIHWRGEE